MKITDSQGTKVYLVPTSTVLTDAASVATAITTGKQIGCLQDLGEITSSRNVQEYSCLSSDDIQKSLGSISLPNLSISLLFDSTDTAGQKELRDMFKDNERRIMIVALNDEVTPLTGNPTYIYFEAGLSSAGVAIQKDNAVMYNVTIEICSNPKQIDAA
jgi:hypothetical protein